MKVIIAYDISTDDTRARVSALLATHGARIQKSVYECFIDDTQLAEVLAKTESWINLKHDVVHAFPVCISCAERRTAIGQDTAIVDDAYWIAF